MQRACRAKRPPAEETAAESSDGEMFPWDSVYSARAGIIVGREAAIVASVLFF